MNDAYTEGLRAGEQFLFASRPIGLESPTAEANMQKKMTFRTIWMVSKEADGLPNTFVVSYKRLNPVNARYVRGWLNFKDMETALAAVEYLKTDTVFMDIRGPMVDVVESRVTSEEEGRKIQI